MKCVKCGGTGVISDPEEMRIRREHSGLSQAEMARRMKVHASYLCDLEQGRRDWNDELRRRFEAVIKKIK